MKRLILAAGVLFGSAQAYADMDCKAGGTGPGADALVAKLAPNITIGETDIQIDLLPSGFDALFTTAELPQIKKQAKCKGSWEGVVHLPYFGRLIGVEYNVFQATFDFLDSTAPSDNNEVLKALGGNVYIKGKAIVDGREDNFEKNLKLPGDQDQKVAACSATSVFPLVISKDLRTIRENISVCGTDIKIHLDEIHANVRKGESFAFASASMAIPAIRLVFAPVLPTDPECVNRKE